MSTHFINGVACTPAALVDEKGNRVIFSHVINSRELERFARHICITMGCRAVLALPLMTGLEARTTSVPRTMSLVKRLGDTVRQARAAKQPVIDNVLSVTGGSRLFAGKLIDVQRRTEGGYNRGQVVIEGFDQHSGKRLRIAFQNENLVAWRDDGVVLACVPSPLRSMIAVWKPRVRSRSAARIIRLDLPIWRGVRI